MILERRNKITKTNFILRRMAIYDSENLADEVVETGGNGHALIEFVVHGLLLSFVAVAGTVFQFGKDKAVNRFRTKRFILIIDYIF